MTVGGEPDPPGFPFKFFFSEGGFNYFGTVGNIFISYFLSCILVGLSNYFGKEKYWLKSLLFIPFFWILFLLSTMIYHSSIMLESPLEIVTDEFFLIISLILTIPILVLSLISIAIYLLFQNLLF